MCPTAQGTQEVVGCYYVTQKLKINVLPNYNEFMQTKKTASTRKKQHNNLFLERDLLGLALGPG